MANTMSTAHPQWRRAPRTRVISILLLMAAGCGVGGEEVQRFSDEQALLNWMATLSESEPLESVRVTRRDGRVAGVSIDDAGDRAILARRLGGDEGIFVLAGEVHSTDFLRSPDPAAAPARRDTATVSRALTSDIPSDIPRCADSGLLCTANSSSNFHINLGKVVYHSVGGSTSVTRGGFQETRYAPVELPGCRPSRLPCPRGCLPGDVWVQTGRSEGYCRHTEGWHNIYLENVYFTGDHVVAEVASTAAANVPSLGLGKSTFGAATAPCFPGGPSECEINGVCTLHDTTDLGGQTRLTTADGSYDCEP